MTTRRRMTLTGGRSLAGKMFRTTGPLEVVSLMQIALNVAHGGSNTRELGADSS